jgi:Archaeal DNA polymerase II, small subunit/DNA polymerase delta, subunit B
VSSQRAVEVVTRLAEHGLNADREAVTLLSQAADLPRVIDALLARTDAGALRVTAADVRAVTAGAAPPVETEEAVNRRTVASPVDTAPNHESSDHLDDEKDPLASDAAAVEITDAITGHSTGTGVYDDFVAIFRDRYERLSELLAGRVPPRTVDSVRRMSGGAAAAVTGLISDIRTTRSGHTLIELEDPTGVFPCLSTATARRTRSSTSSCSTSASGSRVGSRTTGRSSSAMRSRSPTSRARTPPRRRTTTRRRC